MSYSYKTIPLAITEMRVDLHVLETNSLGETILLKNGC